MNNCDDLLLEEILEQNRRRNDPTFDNPEAAKARAYIKKPGSNTWEKI